MKNIYLDVDGVLNALSKKAPTHNTGWEGEWSKEMVDGGSRAYSILWSHELIEAINELDAREDIQFIWLTTWMHMARTNLSPVLGITNGHKWPVLIPKHGDAHGWRPNVAWWKLDQIKEHTDFTQPEQFVWIDDDISVMGSAIVWMEDQANGRIISPNSQHGLAQRHIDLIKTFLSI